MSRKITIYEALGVLIVLTAIAIISGQKLSDWSAALAVFIGFLHSQLSFDLAEGAREVSKENAAALLRRLFMAKEAVWIATFALIGSWPLLIGACIFISYPLIRPACRRDLPNKIG